MKKESEGTKQQFANFGRTFSLVFNRSFMYAANHPFQIEAIDSAYQVLTELLEDLSPVVFILNRERFYVDEEPLDPRLSVSRIVAHFKKTGIESISFYQGAEKNDLRLFLEIATSSDKYPNAEAMNKALFKKRVKNIKINHIFYKKVSAEDEVISRDVLDKVTPEMTGKHQDEIKKMFMDSVFDSVLQEEFVKNLSLKNLLKNPNGLSKEMIAADLKTAKQHEHEHENNNESKNENLSESVKLNKNKKLNKSVDENENEGPRPGQFLLHQLEMIDQDVERNLSEENELNLPDLASALFSMRKKLTEGIEAQKALGIAYANEEQVLSKANEITDKVIIKLLKEEYKGGEISVSRLAQILCRLIPEANELKRLLPMIKSALLEEGMSQADFMSLIQELGRELQSDELAGILAESAEEIGIDGGDIIQQLKENPLQSAEMIYLASELRKGGGDEKALTDVLVNYVEKIGSKYAQELSQKKGKEGEKQFQQTLAEVKTNLTQHLGKMDIKDDLLVRLEERVNQRMDDVFDKLRLEWIKSHSNASEQKDHTELTVLETLEKSVSEDEDLSEILKIIRKKVESEEIDENDFDQIYPEIVKQEQLRKSEYGQMALSSEIMRDQMLMKYIDKEIARAQRYETPISALGFTLVKARAKSKSQPGQVKTKDVVNALLHKLAEIFRTPDIVGELRKNNFVVLLPMTHLGQAKVALRRAMKTLHLKPIDVCGIALEINVAGVVVNIDLKEKIDAESLVETLSVQLTDMATRIGNLHAYS
ncbi:MAG: hypothetical protein V2J65_35535 [Desulfobacteraceae bacterium]|jgi:hypothetical protein|nr:hypothetical protein [Desulfobacteraceae bacterium]